MAKRLDYTKEEFEAAVKSSISIAGALTKIGLVGKGGNYRVFKRFALKHNIDCSHFKGQSHSSGKTIGPKRDLQDYLSNKYPAKSYDLKNRLISEGLKLHKCEKCCNESWLGCKIPLELHHVNGNSSDNTLSNLQLLCPNCHATTDNYRGKNIKMPQ